MHEHEESQSPSMRQILDKYTEIFKEPTQLPPKR